MNWRFKFFRLCIKSLGLPVGSPLLLLTLCSSARIAEPAAAAASVGIVRWALSFMSSVVPRYREGLQLGESTGLSPSIATSASVISHRFGLGTAPCQKESFLINILRTSSYK